MMILGCGEGYKTPADIKGTVAWLDCRSALPVFPFGTNPIYFYVNSERSPICRTMNEKVFSRPEIIKYMNKHFTCITLIPDSIEATNFLGQEFTGKGLINALKVEGYPSHYFFDKGGVLKGTRTGYIGYIEFKQLLNFMAEGYVEKYDFQTFQSMSEAELDTTWGDF